MAGEVTLSPSVSIGSDEKLTYAKILALVSGLLASLNDNSIASSKLISVAAEKLASGFMAPGVVIKSNNYVVDSSGNCTSGFAFKADGSIDSPGLKLRPDGTIIIGYGTYKLTISPDGSFTWGVGGAAIRITNMGQLMAGGLDPDSSPFVVQPSGAVKIKGWGFSSIMHEVDLGAITGLTDAPRFSPDGGAFDTTLQVTMSSWSGQIGSSGLRIFYTTDGSTPTTSSTEYTGPTTLSATTTIKAIAMKFGLVSAISSKTFTKNASPGDTVSNPVFDPLPGTFTPAGGGQAVQITCPTSGATIVYTTDGSTPSATNGTAIASGNSVTLYTGTTTLKAFAYKSGSGDSDVVSGTYTVTSGGAGGVSDQVATPQFNKATGIYGQTAVSGPLTCATSGATIKWRRWSGTTWTAWTTYAGGNVSIGLGGYLEMQGIKAGMVDSDTGIAENAYGEGGG